MSKVRMVIVQRRRPLNRSEDARCLCADAHFRYVRIAGADLRAATSSFARATRSRRPSNSC